MNHYRYPYDAKNNNIQRNRPSTVTKRKVQSTKFPHDKFLPLISLNKDKPTLTKGSSFTYSTQFRTREKSLGIMSNSNIKLPKLCNTKMNERTKSKQSLVSLMNRERRRPIPITNYRNNVRDNATNEWDAYWSWKSSKLSSSKLKFNESNDEESFSNRSSSGYSSNLSNHSIDD